MRIVAWVYVVLFASGGMNEMRVSVSTCVDFGGKGAGKSNRRKRVIT